MSLKYVLAERVGLKLQPRKWLEKHASLASRLIMSFFLTIKPEPHSAQLYHADIYTPVVRETSSVGKQIKALFPCKFMKTRAEVERRSEGKKKKKNRGRDGGWK